MTWQPMTSVLNDRGGAFDLGFGTGFDSFYDGTVQFDVPWTEADDYDDTYLIYEMFAKAVGA